MIACNNWSWGTLRIGVGGGAWGKFRKVKDVFLVKNWASLMFGMNKDFQQQNGIWGAADEQVGVSSMDLLSSSDKQTYTYRIHIYRHYNVDV